MLEAVGVSRDVAETHVQIFTEIMENQLATKQDQKDLRSEMSKEFSDIRQEMKTEFAAVRSEMNDGFTAVRSEFSAVRSEMKDMGYQLTVRMGVISASLATFVIAALTLLLPIVLHVK